MDQYNGSHDYFIISTISHNKNCAAKIFVADALTDRQIFDRLNI